MTYGGEYDFSDESSDSISKRDKITRRNTRHSSKMPKADKCDTSDTRRHAKNESLQTDRNLEENNTVYTKDKTSDHLTDTKKKWKDKEKDIDDENKTMTYGGEYDFSDESSDSISKRDKITRRNTRHSSKMPKEDKCNTSDTRRHAKNESLQTDRNLEENDTVHTKDKTSDHLTDTKKKWKDKEKDIDDENKTITYGGEHDFSNESSDSIPNRDKIKRRNTRHFSKMAKEDRKCDTSDIRNKKKTTTYREEYDTSNEASDDKSKWEKIKRRHRRRSLEVPKENRDITDVVRHATNGFSLTRGDIKSDNTDCSKIKDNNAGNLSDDYKKTQKDKANAWIKCVEMLDVRAAERLLQNDNIPDQESVILACIKFGRKHQIVKDMCKKVCTYIQNQQPENIRSVWPSYRYVQNAPFDMYSENDVVFVIVTKSETSIDVEKIKMYKTYVRASSEISQESRAVNEHETRVTQYRDKNIKRKRKKIVKYLDDNIDNLLSKHSNITTVSASLFKSRNFKQGHKHFEENLCIVLYVHVKGYVPLHEDPFDRKIDEYDVDVRECVFTPLMCGPNDFHSILKMGLEIGTLLTKPGTSGNIGTLGHVDPFEPRYFVTCAHVVMSSEELISLSESRIDVEIYQPIQHESRKICGRAIRAVYFQETDVNRVGVEAALVEIVDRGSTGFELPYSPILEELELTGNLSEVLQSGIYRPNYGKDQIKLIKYGCVSNVTQGKYTFFNPSITLETNGIRLRNQITIIHSHDFEQFAVQGDSGAVVFEFIDDKLYPTCMIEGTMGDGRIVATPLINVLVALHIRKPEDVIKLYNSESDDLDMDSSDTETCVFDNDMEIE
ncbi:uncharacterized protein LOC132724411 [Ruditapes philippinarum]|uniref:uncharacterized protein LOC132724411 n=1 Tax=Ruditapes philippinarum TaxID=129788 RepID=UPI00295AD813|nr:uncharacterized protein LOC132724411 [Ruditapes philippinarum]